MNGPLRSALAKVQIIGLAVGAIALVVCVVGLAIHRPIFFEAYLVGYLFWLGVVLGSMGLLMVHKLTGGKWGEAITWPLLASVRTLPLAAVMFVPIIVAVCLGHVSRVYFWADLPNQRHFLAEMTPHQQVYLTVPFVLSRAVIYFAIWLTIGFFLTRWTNIERLKRLSAGGLVVLGLTVTFAAFDWIMSLQPGWYSTIFGMLVLVGQLVSALAVVTMVAIVASRLAPAERTLPGKSLHDLGNLLLMAVSLWAYISFSQFLIIYYANLPEEIRWYVDSGRTAQPWKSVAIGLIVFHFAVPLLVLLSRQNKRNTTVMLGLALGLLVVHFADMLWLVVPSVHMTQPPELHVSWAPVMFLAAVIGIGGLWIWAFARQLRLLALVPATVSAQGGHR